MRIAILSVTEKGARLGESLGAGLVAEIDLFSLARGSLKSSAHPFDKLSALVTKIFSEYDGLVFIMAAGIAVRVIAPHVRDKRQDPAVVVMDDAGIHAISLLSGHIGGANELARRVAEVVGARPVITTATDIVNLPAPDVVAVRLRLAIDPFDSMKAVNSAIAAGKRVPFFIDRELQFAAKYCDWAAETGMDFSGFEALQDVDHYDAAVVISDKVLNIPRLHIYLRPATLSIGIGCRKGVSGSEILAAIQAACHKIGRSPGSIAVLGSSTVKQAEAGLLAAAEQLGAPVLFYDNQQIRAVIDKHKLAVSRFVEEEIGVGNICEASALLGARTSSLLLAKTVYPKITIAIAEVISRWWESAPAIAGV